MKTLKLIIVALLLGVTSIATAWADWGHARIGVYVGPYWGPMYYPARTYYPDYPSFVVERQAPTVYVEQQSAPVAAVSTIPTDIAPVNYWYYCVAEKGYYPYVKACPGGWQKMLPQ